VPALAVKVASARITDERIQSVDINKGEVNYGSDAVMMKVAYGLQPAAHAF
jgi:hypothetical protein